MKSYATAKRSRVPTCTHISMERVYLGDKGYCEVCGKIPSMGFLYECRQDWDFELRDWDEESDDDNSNRGGKSDLRRELEGIGLSESIIVAAEEGRYTDEQMEKLKDMKLELNAVIEDATYCNSTNHAAKRLAAAWRNPSNNDGSFNSAFSEDAPPRRCSYRACHHCRPYYIQRIYISFDAVYYSQFRPITPSDDSILSTKPAHIVRNISLSTNAAGEKASPTMPYTMCTDTLREELYDGTQSQDSISTFKTTQSDIDCLSSQRRRRARFFRLGYQTDAEISRAMHHLPLFSKLGLKAAFQGIFQMSRNSSSEGSNITLPMSRTGTAREFDSKDTMRDFDMGALRRVREQKERTEMRYGISGGFEGIDGERSAHHQALGDSTPQGELESASMSSSSSDFTVYSCVSESSHGSGIEVDGGVALTEEAVETRVPDILTTPTAVELAQSKTLTQVQREEEGATNENAVSTENMVTQM